ncbi:MAG TPA: 4-alpha-glucanotransferase [Thermoanaerobaculia bacterium]|nr:4-alpha-glucanotransferase [Thermoanaerobaculia bacterium]
MKDRHRRRRRRHRSRLREEDARRGRAQQLANETLRALAHLYGVQTSYHDAWGRLVEAGEEPLLAVLAALGSPLSEMAEVGEALAFRRDELAARLVPPALVAWDGRLSGVPLRVAPGEERGVLACHLDLEAGERRAWTCEVESLAAADHGDRWLALPDDLPPGYHTLHLKLGGRAAEARVIAAPARFYLGDGRPRWGVFLPLYALRTARGWGAGDLTDLEALAGWTAALGGGAVATLPLLASFLDAPAEPSPYAPASRLFWNELYLDPQRLPEAALCPAARRLLESPEIDGERRALAAQPLVDYPRLAILKRRLLEEMALWFWSQTGPRRAELEAFLAARPELASFAAFRAVGDRRGESWQGWPERLRLGTLAPADYDEEDYRYHLWVQWAAESQMQEVAGAARRQGAALALDLPLGVHASSFDVWRERDLFADGVAAGAPPDLFFTQGQNWGFPPLQPERLRERGYDHLIACLRHHLAHAGMLRIDHVMQLHRLFWVPQGMAAGDGVYVRYPAEELYAVLALESHRHRAMIVGENLGTVPPEVGEAMARHQMLGMYVVQYELAPAEAGPGALQRPPPALSVASLNTHDMPTFRGFWEGRDIEELRRLGFFDAAQAQAERDRRAAQRERLAAALPPRLRAAAERGGDRRQAVLEALLEELAAGPAHLLLINLEDLWGESEPQNVPGTQQERPNWRRKARLTLEELAAHPDLIALLRRIDDLRRKGRA